MSGRLGERLLVFVPDPADLLAGQFQLLGYVFHRDVLGSRDQDGAAKLELGSGDLVTRGQVGSPGSDHVCHEIGHLPIMPPATDLLPLLRMHYKQATRNCPRGGCPCHG